jgi:hypothetical protein
MKVQIQQRGGFAGITQTLVDVDSASIDPAQATELEKLAHQVESMAASHAKTANPTGADFLTYDITLHEGKHRKMLTLVDDDSPAMVKVREVLAQLSTLARGGH